MKAIAKSMRAIYAGVVAGLTGLSAVLVGEVGLGDLTDGQWVTIALGAIVAAGGVWGFVNPK